MDVKVVSHSLPALFPALTECQSQRVSEPMRTFGEETKSFLLPEIATRHFAVATVTL
jgi:hypothetical protein